MNEHPPQMLRSLLDIHHAAKCERIMPYYNPGNDPKPSTAKERTRRKARRKQSAASRRQNRGR